MAAIASNSQESVSSRNIVTPCDNSIDTGALALKLLDPRQQEQQQRQQLQQHERPELVESVGNWEGVVWAAALLEDEEAHGGGGGGGGGCTSDGSYTDSNTGTAIDSYTTGTATGTAVSTCVSDFTFASEARSNGTREQKYVEIRQEVEALVRHVVPEEIDNVDEMMSQFAGREEELVETLRNMQERAVAQKARAARHKAAQEEARRSVQRRATVFPGGATKALLNSTAMEETRNGSIVQSPMKLARKNIRNEDTSPGSDTSGCNQVDGSTMAKGGSDIEPRVAPVAGKVTPMSFRATGATPTRLPRQAVGAGIDVLAEMGSSRGVEADSDADTDVDSGFQSATFRSSVARRRRTTALEQAIEKGDWDEVGAQVDRLSQLDAARQWRVDSSTTLGAAKAVGRHLEGINVENDRMMDRGDWLAVVETANLRRQVLMKARQRQQQEQQQQKREPKEQHEPHHQKQEQRRIQLQQQQLQQQQQEEEAQKNRTKIVNALYGRSRFRTTTIGQFTR